MFALGQPQLPPDTILTNNPPYIHFKIAVYQDCLNLPFFFFFEKFQSETFLDSLSTKEPISVLLVVTKA